jgi:hypothetical protein
MGRSVNSGTLTIVVALFGVAFASHSLMAEGLKLAPVRDKTVAKECAACHMLYPSALLPARSWATMLDNLQDHFGENAALDEATTKAIADYLVANAADAGGQGWRTFRDLDPQTTPTRITDLPWWKRKHEKRDRVSPTTLAKNGAKFRGDCKACHRGAEQGLFDDD